MMNKNDMKYKMLILDIDDTLVPRGGGISQKNAAAIQKAREAGVYVTLATGRGYYGSSHVFRELGLDTYVINYAGAVINDIRTDKPIFVTELDNSFVQEILAMADDMNLHAHLYQGDRIVYEREHPYASAYCAALNLPYSIDSDIRKKNWQNVPKVLIITEPERVSELLPFFKKHFENRVEVSASSPGFMEFNRLGANKGTAAELLASRLGFGRDEVAAAGDNTLDLELVRWAGLGAVVADGNPDVKREADVIIPACAEDGVAYLIENYILKDDANGIMRNSGEQKDVQARL